MVLDIDPGTRAIIFGALLMGEGEMCVAGVAFDEVSTGVPVRGVGFTMPTNP